MTSSPTLSTDTLAALARLLVEQAEDDCSNDS